MLKTLGAQVKEFKKDSILTPVFMILEVIMETIIPLIMGSIISGGVQKGNLRHIYLMGALMVLTAFKPLGRRNGWKIRCKCIDRICEKLKKGNV